MTSRLGIEILPFGMDSGSSSVIRVLSHNVFWFQGVPFASDQPGEPVPGIAAECAVLYERIRPTILCLQEIQSPTAAELVSTRLALSAYYTVGRELVQYGACLLAKQGQLLAASTNTEVLVQRVGQLFEFPLLSGKSLRIANVHLPSDRQLDAEAAAQRRVLELREILRMGPDLVCGDLNERPRGLVAQELFRAGYHDCAALTGNEDRSTSIGARRTDYIWIHAKLAGLVRDYGVFPPHSFLSSTAAKTFLSDHLPLWADLETA
ncbi:MAG: endonuclease/exonuclease/phosphatase family protein [Kiritimatiellia bacterium]